MSHPLLLLLKMFSILLVMLEVENTLEVVFLNCKVEQEFSFVQKVDSCVLLARRV